MDQGLVETFLHGQLHIGPRAEELARGGRHHDPQRRRDGADIELSLARAAHRIDLAARLGHERQDGPRIGNELFAVDGRTDAVGTAIEQAHAQVLLERAEAFAERGLRHVEIFRRDAETRSLHHRDEIFELPQFQNALPPGWTSRI